MENVLSIASILILAISVAFFVTSLVLRKRVKNDLAKREEALELKETEYNELRQIAAGVTHEINNAMSIIIGRNAQLMKLEHDENQDKIIKNLQKTSDRVVESVKGLRQFIYPDKNEVEEFIELQVLMDDVFKLAGQRLRNHGISVKLIGLDHKVVKAKKTQLEQLVLNMLNQSVERLGDLQDKWIQIVAADENGHFNIYFMDASGEVGDKISHKQYNEILESNHGHLTVNQNNLIVELPKLDHARYHY